MSVRNLHHAFAPRSVALIGASGKPGSVGSVLLANLLSGGFAGDIWPVNPKYQSLAGIACYPSVAALPSPPDLAIIVTPAASVPGLIGELANGGCRAAVVISAGVSAASGLRQAMLEAARPSLFRIFGPNTVGLLIPPIGLNASFAHLPAKPGRLALVSQSGAIVTTLIDWAADKALGFSRIVSLGDMADVDAGDMLDLLAGDPDTDAVLLYLESIPNPRKFMSAARAASRVKPVIAIKSGRHAEAAKAAQTHTGALSGADRVTEAALKRAGILRVTDLDALFAATQAIGRFGPLAQARTAIVTNGGGAGVLTVDQLIDRGSSLAELSSKTIDELDRSLPSTWSRANPVDIIGDAPPERYVAALKAVADDPAVDVILVMNCPTALASPIEAARAVAALVENGRLGGKPVLACWLGEHVAREGRAILESAGIASFETPAEAAAAIAYLVDWNRAQQQLTRVPASHGRVGNEASQFVSNLLADAARQGRTMLSEAEAKAALSAYGIPVPETRIGKTQQDVLDLAADLLSRNKAVVVKLLSHAVSHKSDMGGVALNIATPDEARQAAATMTGKLAALMPGTIPDGFTVQPMIRRPHAQELILGMTFDPIFGPVILFGAGGVAVEVMDDTAIGLPPLDEFLAGDLIDATRVSRLLKGYRDRKPADRAAILSALESLSQMIIDCPAIKGLDINPLLADAEGVMALDARIEIDLSRIGEQGPNRSLAIRPWPSGWERDVTNGGTLYAMRPILPADMALYPDFLARVSEADLRARFVSTRPSFDDQMLKRLTQLDYDRDMAFVLTEADGGALAGIARLSGDPDHERADYAILIRSDLQGRGLGWAMMEQLIAYAKADGYSRMDGRVLADNARMLEMAREFGFVIGPVTGNPPHHPASLVL